MKGSNRFQKKPRIGTAAEGAQVLESGGVIAFPTETYYGLGVDPTNPAAVERLFRLKERDRSKPILVLVEDMATLETIIDSTPQPYNPLIEKYWPGPLTLIFPAKATVPEAVTSGTGKIGVRISSSATVQKLLSYWKKPVTATSANKSGGLPAQSAADIFEIFGGDIDCVVDGGPAPGGTSSTVVDCQNGRLKILRRGKVELVGEDRI